MSTDPDTNNMFWEFVQNWIYLDVSMLTMYRIEISFIKGGKSNPAQVKEIRTLLL